MPGEQIGRYTIDRRIGSGGMALTLRCRLDGLGGFQKRVVVKMMQPHLLESPDVVRMFLDEARLCAGLAHPNIPQIFEVGEQDGLPYLVMEYIPGPDLGLVRRQMEQHGEVAYGAIANIFGQVSRALAYAHALTDTAGRSIRIIHRDVSLPNVLIGSDGIARLIDFGIARSAMSSAATEVGMLKGRVAYMSPEQLLGKEIDHRVDIYQVGVCLYWMTTGGPPYSGDNPVAIWNAHIGRAMQRPSEKVLGYPPELEAIVLKAMAEDPAARYQSAAELAAALEGFCASGRWKTTPEDVRAWISRIFPADQLLNLMGGGDGSLGSSAGIRTVNRTPARQMPTLAPLDPPANNEHGLSGQHSLYDPNAAPPSAQPPMLRLLVTLGVVVWVLAGVVFWLSQK